MIKFESTLVTFTEVPDEISLCINCTCCPLHCKECFEPWLQKDYGTILTTEVLEDLIQKHPHISCVCFMGGINDYVSMYALMLIIKKHNLKVALYSGSTEQNELISSIADYYKIGPYIPEFGPLNKKTTNQKFLKKSENGWEDITYKFQREKV